MKKWWRISAVVLVLALLLSSTGVAQGWWGWCWWDPVVTIDGKTVNIELAVEEAGVSSITGTVPVKVRVPKGIEATVEEEYTFANGVVTKTQIVHGKSKGKYGLEGDIEVVVKVPTKGKEEYRMALKVSVDGTQVAFAEGMTGKGPLSLRFSMP